MKSGSAKATSGCRSSAATAPSTESPGSRSSSSGAGDEQPALELGVELVADSGALSTGGAGLIAHDDLAGGEYIAAGCSDVGGGRRRR